MSESSILREYFLKLGWKIDEAQFRKFNQTLSTVTATLKNTAAESTRVALEVAGSTTLMAEHFEDLYYTAIRAGTSVTNLEAYSYGAQQIGVSAEAAKAQLEQMGMAMRLNPGLTAFARNLGVKDTQDSAKAAVELVERLQKMPFPIAARIGEMFGIAPSQLLLMERGIDDMKKFEEQRKKLYQNAGVDPQKLADAAVKFQQAKRDLEGKISVLGDQAFAKFIPLGMKAIDLLNKLVDEAIKLGAATHGWSSAIGEVIAGFGSLAALRGTLGWLGRMIGLPGAGAAAGAAGEAGAAAGAVGEAGAVAGAAVTIVEAGFIATIVPIVAAAVLGYVAANRNFAERITRLIGLDPHGHELWNFATSPFESITKAVGLRSHGHELWNLATSPFESIVKGMGLDPHGHELQTSIKNAAKAVGSDVKDYWRDNFTSGYVPKYSSSSLTNNPMNLRPYAGYTGSQAEVFRGDKSLGMFDRFDTVTEGYTEMIRQLGIYANRDKISTTRALVGKIAPSNENDQAAYLKSLESLTGFKPDQQFKLDDPDTLEKLARALVKIENPKLYDEAEIHKAIAAKYGDFFAKPGGGTTVTVEAKTDINVQGAQQPEETARRVARRQRTVWDDIARAYTQPVIPQGTG